MPIVTLYGAKGGTGRTTSATAIALGMLSCGMNVTLVETFEDDQPLERWAGDVNKTAAFGGDLFSRSCLVPHELDHLMRISSSDDQNAIIIDTGPAVSAVRTYAFELADVILMPFAGFLDAESGIATAAAHFPGSTDLRALPMRVTDELSSKVSDWVPVLKNALPADERLILGSAEAAEFAVKMSRETPFTISGYGGLPETLYELSIEVIGACHTRRQARALRDSQASLGVSA